MPVARFVEIGVRLQEGLRFGLGPAREAVDEVMAVALIATFIFW